MITVIHPEQIKPLHGVRSKAHFSDLVADMRENKWQGRPLLVIERESDYVAWTGSHRIAAAVEAGLDGVPCYVLDERLLLPLGYDAEKGHVFDYERLKILREIGDETAIHLMWQEGRS